MYKNPGGDSYYLWPRKGYRWYPFLYDTGATSSVFPKSPVLAMSEELRRELYPAKDQNVMNNEDADMHPNGRQALRP